jgi:hypothetical protein
MHTILKRMKPFSRYLCLLGCLFLVYCTADPIQKSELQALLNKCAPVSYAPVSFPLDDVLNISHIQSIGTHNSYHKASPLVSVLEWAYDMPSLEQQLEMGVRQFEFDVVQKKDSNRFETVHLELIDAKSNCDDLSECLEHIKCWSQSHPNHVPILIMIEAKDLKYEPSSKALTALMQLEEQITLSWGLNNIVLPLDIQKDASSLSQAVSKTGWPSLKNMRGKALFLYSDIPKVLRMYASKSTVLFLDGKGMDVPYGVIHSITDVEEDEILVRAFVKKNHLVRTRADSGGHEARRSDFSRFHKALQSGAHFISTDYVTPSKQFRYAIKMPGKWPVRCNVLVSPYICSSEALEKAQN